MRATPAALTATPPAPGLAGQLPALPTPQPMVMPRITASVDAGALGSVYTGHGGDVTQAGTAAQFNSGANQVAWAIYQFGGTPGEVISGGSYTITGLDAGETVYVAISDYVANHWMFLPLADGSDVTFTLPNASPGAYQSALGNTSLLIAAFGGDSWKLEHVSLTYGDRHNITGTVLDKTGNPVPGVTIRTPVGSLSTVTDSSGNYTLAGLPDGDWPILATLDGWTFYPQPQMVTVSGADAVAGDLLGDPHGAHFDATETLPDNNHIQNAPFWDFAANGPLHESVSADSDYLDVYKFSVPAAGKYVLYYSNPDRNILSPVFAVIDPSVTSIVFAEDIYRGEEGISFTVSDPSQPLIFLFAGSGGGGKYTMTLSQQPTGLLGAYMQNGADYRFQGLMQVMRHSDGMETDYFTRSPLQNGTVLALYDRSYPVGDVTVTPLLPNHTFTPAAADLTVAASGTVANQVFSFTPPAVADSYEPNDSIGTAHDLGALPFNSAVPLQITADGSGDYQDVYKVTPAAGLGLRVDVLYTQVPGESIGSPRITLNIEDSSSHPVSTSYSTPDGLSADMTELTDGSPYYIILDAYPSYPPDKAVINYGLQVQSFAAHRFQIGARVGGVNPVDGMKFVVYDQDFASRYVATNETADFLTPARYVPDGTQLRVDCFRGGTPFDGMTQRVTVTSDTTLQFDAANLGQDSHEPNGTFATANTLGFLPATVSATYGAFDDTDDFYAFGPGDGKPFKIELTSCAPGVGLSLYLKDSAGSPIGSARLAKVGDTVYMPNDGNPHQAFDVGTLNDYAFPYTLTISNSDAYKVSGVLKNDALTGIDGVVVNRTTGAVAIAAASSGGSYSFQFPLGPGSYDLVAYALGYAPDVQEQNVNITTADATVNFLNFTASGDDNFEPNNTAATAHPIALDTDYVASAHNIAAADVDYYSIPLTLGDQVRITATPEHEWEGVTLTLHDLYSSGYNEDLVGRVTTNGTQQVDYTAVSTANYIIEVDGAGPTGNNAARYALRVHKVN
jgi:hypothetical protein